jgi:hypothetical protein
MRYAFTNALLLAGLRAPLPSSRLHRFGVAEPAPLSYDVQPRALIYALATNKGLNFHDLAFDEFSINFWYQFTQVR